VDQNEIAAEIGMEQAFYEVSPNNVCRLVICHHYQILSIDGAYSPPMHQ
jgi:hypothetical protein